MRPIAVNKPHLRKHKGVWSCFKLDTRRVGCGYSPKEAYEEWLECNS
jgi:hypothetical protein